MASCCASRARRATNVARAQRFGVKSLSPAAATVPVRHSQTLTKDSTVFQPQISIHSVDAVSLHCLHHLISSNCLIPSCCLRQQIFTGCLPWHLWPPGPLNPCWQNAHDENTLSIKINRNFTVEAAVQVCFWPKSKECRPKTFRKQVMQPPCLFGFGGVVEAVPWSCWSVLGQTAIPPKQSAGSAWIEWKPVRTLWTGRWIYKSKACW